jgi:hypothetical protein
MAYETLSEAANSDGGWRTVRTSIAAGDRKQASMRHSPRAICHSPDVVKQSINLIDAIEFRKIVRVFATNF